MSLLGNLIGALATVVDILLNVYMWMIVARAIISWVSPNPYNPIVNFLVVATEPVLRYARRIIPLIGGTIDLSPILVLVAIVFLRRFLVQTLHQLATNLSAGAF
ncbi:YggT family protein [Desulfobacterota bacterium AH_259_B03_O07]|nr:YggT family protein [Desulfobacterota bacterium AH_259_B03_O07]